jgi:ATP-dependent RNA helicase RhlE
MRFAYGRALPMPFAALRLNASLLKALAEEGYRTPTPIQERTIPPALEGRDVLGCAQTGTGKTAAFALPLIQRLVAAHEIGGSARRTPGRPHALILAPTRELAVQIGESLATYGRHAKVRVAVVFGGVGQNPQVKALRDGVDVVVATPGRLLDLIQQRHCSLAEVHVLVLDEADRMLDMGFIKPIRTITGMVPARRQTMLFSATMPKEVRHLAESLLRDPVKVEVTPVASAAPKIEQSVIHVARDLKQPLLERLLEQDALASVVVFTRTKHGADRVMKRLLRANVDAAAIHGNRNQNQRQRALESFRSGRTRVLVATDVAARGIDVDGITHVINYDIPVEPESYVHRIGRTGRAGATGQAIAFCEPAERGALKAIEKLIGKAVPVAPLPQGLAALSSLPTAARTEPKAPRGQPKGARPAAKGGRNEAKGTRTDAPAPQGRAEHPVARHPRAHALPSARTAPRRGRGRR